jgi:muconate cycloisomerase
MSNNLARPLNLFLGSCGYYSLMHTCKLAQIIATPVIVPTKPDSIMSPGIEDDWSNAPAMGSMVNQSTDRLAEIPKFILRGRTSDGLVGIGETHRSVNLDHLRRNAKRLCGRNLFEMRLASLDLPEDREYDGFELLAYDLVGKSLGVPAYQLLGGACRDRVLCSMWTGRRTPADAGRKAAEGQARGFDTIKFKCNQHDDVAAWASEVRRQCGSNMQMIFDPNQRWRDFELAAVPIRALKDGGFNILAIEDPVERTRLDDFHRLREFGLNIVLHIALSYSIFGQRADDALRALHADAVDGFNFNGSMASFVRLADLANLANKPCWHGSGVDLGILEAGFLHSAAASPACTWPSDIFGRLVRKHDLLREQIQFDGKYAVVPTGPGLGVDLDETAIEHYRAGADIDLMD